MFCSQMRLQDRRISTGRDVRRTIVPGIVQRPCLLKNLESNCNTSDDEQTPRPGFDRPKKNTFKEKPQLIVVSLKMQSDTKTLAQEDVKRDPRRMPFFCEQYKQSKKDQRQRNRTISPSATNKTANLLTDLIVRGVEMLNSSIRDADDNGDSNNYNDCDNNSSYNDLAEMYSNKYYRFLGEATKYNLNEMAYGNAIELMQVQLTDCCQCMRDVKLFKKEEDSLANKKAAELQSRSLDSRYLTVTSGQIDGSGLSHSGTEDCPLKPPVIPFTYRKLKRLPSPRTRQVINITMNTRK